MFILSIVHVNNGLNGRKQPSHFKLDSDELYPSLKVMNTIFLFSPLKIGVLLTLIILLDTEFIGIISSSIVIGVLDLSTSVDASR